MGYEHETCNESEDCLLFCLKNHVKYGNTTAG